MAKPTTAPGSGTIITKSKDTQVLIRIDSDLKQLAEQKANLNGWPLATVIRAMLIRWVQGDSSLITPADVGKAIARSPKRTGSKPKS